MKNLSSQNDKHSPFLRIMQKGHKKTGYKKTSGNLLLTLSENDHKRIAQLIAKWIEDKSEKSNSAK
ncbi:MAG: hypothetical protein AAF364_14145 [Pseudomonadota bacterium]|jgi:hypothetical protein|uniref:hypothetical protein n=1 Tax=Alteromonas sp. 009811495 TaxID=3002962 RepID=UPI00237E7E2A|nr:hypothetical protein [Alteromonas sp. 009811495]MEC8231502.1 hypothetical protein [Pseudomonadota bacterium]WDT84473.1 hypothetical protein OZ660_11030 [Alteromonas sp. 009811495]